MENTHPVSLIISCNNYYLFSFNENFQKLITLGNKELLSKLKDDKNEFFNSDLGDWYILSNTPRVYGKGKIFQVFTFYGESTW